MEFGCPVRGHSAHEKGLTHSKPASGPVLVPHLNSHRLPRYPPMTLGTILLVLLILMLLGALPTWPHSKSWGFYPSGGIGLLLLVLIILLLTGRL